MTKKFASQADLEDKQVSFTELADGIYAYTAEGDPNTGVVIGDDAVMVLDAQATPLMARDVIAKIRSVTDKPIKYVALSHYHAARVLGASAYGADEIIVSQDTYDLIVERGEQDFKSETERFPRLFRGVDSIPGLTWPSMAFKGEMTVWMGTREVRLLQLGRGHSKGDTVIWMPKEKVLFSGDLVEYGATPYTGDAYLTDWPRTLERLAELGPAALVPGRGDALTTPKTCVEAIDGTRAFLTTMFESVKEGRQAGLDLKEIYAKTYATLKPDFGHWVIFDHCLPFDVSRAYDEAGGITDPRIWTAERDAEMWNQLEGGQ
ncbi:MAG: MBL fold metallo-hydrolase [Lysobacterales bacterium]|jgi:glyoxylase-like metal-dependent hydrolase (beta-lactamase superfamily II)